MDRNRQDRLRLEASQVELLASPVREAILGAYQTHGPASVNQIGALLRRDPKSLYYQVRHLVACGLLRQVATQPVGLKKEAVFDVVADRFSFDLHLEDPEYRKTVGRAGGTLVRNAAEQFEGSMQAEASRGPLPHGRLARVQVQLSAENVEELQRRLNDLREFMSSNDDPSTEHRVALTTVLIPIL